jgi:phosphatidylserine/phosphatidylglycerophosphate/cardiolipin synthase-like enzyme
MNAMQGIAVGLATVVLFYWGVIEVGRQPHAVAEPSDSSEITIQLCFEPEGQCAGMAVHEINAAKRQILVNAYSFSAGTGIAEALAAARGRGLDVEAIVDKTTPCQRHSAVPVLAAAGIPVWIDSKVRIAHAKVLIIDSADTVEGSFNFSVAARFNSEDMNVVRSPAVAAQYERHWRLRRGASVPYQRREDWCAGGTEGIQQ